MRACITGASSGIGKALAWELAKKGHEVILCARRANELEKIASEIQTKFSVKASCYPVDLLDPTQRKDMVSKIADQFGIPDIWINNAGKGSWEPFMESSWDAHRSTCELNNLALVDLTYQFIQFHKDNPHPTYLMQVASMISYFPLPYYAVYSATKTFIFYLTRALQWELKGKPIHLTLLCPGATQTEFLEKAGQDIQSHAQGMLMTSEKVAEIGVNQMFKKRKVIIPGFSNKMLVALSKILPRGVFAKLVFGAMQVGIKRKGI